MAKNKKNCSVYDSFGYELQNGYEQYGRYETVGDGEDPVFVGYGHYIAIEMVSNDLDDDTPILTVAYETLESERKNIHIALCWMHVRRRFFYAFDLVANIKGLSEETIRESLEAKLLMLIGKIYREEMKLKNLEPARRKEERNLKGAKLWA